MSKPAQVGAGDRLQLTLLFSLIAHGILALGVSFNMPEPSASNAPSLDVILVQTRSETPPDDADFLAQASQQGGGESDEPVRPRSPVSSEVPKPDDGLAPVPIEAGAPDPQPQTRPEVLTQIQSPQQIEQEPHTAEVEERQLPSRDQLIETSVEMARLAAEIERTTEAYARRPKRKFISANTREYEYASYMAAWVAKVERVGNLNYPDEARRRDLYGNLVLTVAIRRDGSIESIDIIQPSGQTVLDDAAIRIVEMAAPYAPLTVALKDDIDILHITRTWQFTPGNVLRGR